MPEHLQATLRLPRDTLWASQEIGLCSCRESCRVSLGCSTPSLKCPLQTDRAQAGNAPKSLFGTEAVLTGAVHPKLAWGVFHPDQRPCTLDSSSCTAKLSTESCKALALQASREACAPHGRRGALLHIGHLDTAELVQTYSYSYGRQEPRICCDIGVQQAQTVVCLLLVP